MRYSALKAHPRLDDPSPEGALHPNTGYRPVLGKRAKWHSPERAKYPNFQGWDNLRILGNL